MCVLYGEEFLRGIALEFNFLERLLESLGVLCERGIGRPTLISLTHSLASHAANEKVIIQAFLLSCRPQATNTLFRRRGGKICSTTSPLCCGTEGAESGRWSSVKLRYTFGAVWS
jgi:hypothetical protein